MLGAPSRAAFGPGQSSTGARTSPWAGFHAGVEEGGEDRQGAAAVGALFNIDSEGASFILHLLQWDCPCLWA